jgi:ribonuclease Z
MKLTFLGTSAGAPTRRRNVTGQALTFDDGRIWLLDCGEATQHRLMEAGLRAKSIERILITHLHGDHVYGIFGMLACIGIAGRDEPVQIVGPRGIGRMIETVLHHSGHDPSFDVVIEEWHDLPAGGWRLPAWNDGWQVTAHPIEHRLPCAGYCLREGDRPGRFHPDKAVAAGVPEGPLWGRLQRGQTVQVDGREIRPETVCDPPRPGRRVLLLGDTSDADSMIAVGQGCDLAVREVTYDDSRIAKAQQWMHSTAGMTGAWAHQMQAKTLIITHLSARYTDEAEDPVMSVSALHAAAAAACPGTQVLVADDLWSYEF